MSDTVWVSKAMTDTRLWKPLTSDFAENDMDAAIDRNARIERGESLKSKDFPTSIFPIAWESYKIGRLPHFFYAGSYWVVSKQVADVLRHFDLGGGGLFPVKIYQKDQVIQVEGEFFCLNFGNVKQAFLLENSSSRLMAGPSTKNSEGRYVPIYYNLPFVPEDDEVALSHIALSGPDIWVDPLLGQTFFISGALRNALKKAKLDGAFRLFKCRVVDSAPSHQGDAS